MVCQLQFRVFKILSFNPELQPVSKWPLGFDQSGFSPGFLPNDAPRMFNEPARAEVPDRW